MELIPGIVAGTILTGVKGLTDTTGQKLDVIIEGIGILKEYCEKDLELSEEEKKEWETRAVSWLRAILDPQVGHDIKVAGWDSSIKPNLKHQLNISGEGLPIEILEKLLIKRRVSTQELDDLQSFLESTEFRPTKSLLLSGYDEDKANLYRQFEIRPDGKRKLKSETGNAEGYIGGINSEDRSMLEEIGGFIEAKIADAFDKQAAIEDLGTKIDNLLARISLVDEAEAGELTDAERKESPQKGEKETDTKTILDEMNRQKEFLAAQLINTKTAVTEARDAVATVDERVKNIAALLDQHARKVFREEYERSWTKPTDMADTRDRSNITIRYRPKDSV